MRKGFAIKEAKNKKARTEEAKEEILRKIRQEIFEKALRKKQAREKIKD